MEGDGEMIKNDSRGKNMVKGKYVLGIAFVAIVLSTILFVMGAVPVINIINPSEWSNCSYQFCQYNCNSK